MELQTKEGFELVKTEDLHKLKKISLFLNDNRYISSLSKVWRLTEKLQKMIDDLEGKKE